MGVGLLAQKCVSFQQCLTYLCAQPSGITDVPKLESGFQGENRRPGVLEDVEANGARSGRDVRMIDFRDELHLDGLERI